MRRDLKPSLRQDTRRVKTLPTDIVKEVVINVGDDTVLHYTGNPMMNPAFVADMESQPLGGGTELSYGDKPFIGIGLATDNVAGANDDVVSNPATEPDHVLQGSPLIGSGGAYQPVDGSNANGVVYTQVSPMRSAILLDLTNIPRDAIIESATLELTRTPSRPDENPAEYDYSADTLGQNTTQSVWPSGGVEIEVMNLIEDTDPTCTWNAKSTQTETSPSGQGTFPASDQRWWKQPQGVVPPNPIGIAQNTRRSDTGEPVETIDDQVIDTTQDQGQEYGNEYYGHIGYGLRGGGCIVNTNPENSYPSFNVSFDDWGGSGSGVFSVDVKNLVEHSMANQNQKCNLLLRAKNWTENDAEANPDEQRRYPENEVTIQPLTFDSVYLANATDTSVEITEIENDKTLEAVPVNLNNADSVNYTWQIEVPVVYEYMTNLDFNFPTSAVEGTEVSVTNVAYQGGDGTNEVVSYAWFLNGSPVGLNSPSFIIPTDPPSGGKELTVEVTVTNSVESDIISLQKNLDVSADSLGSFVLSKVPDDTEVIEGDDVTVQMSSITSVADPYFEVTWTADASGSGPEPGFPQTDIVQPSGGVATSTVESFQVGSLDPPQDVRASVQMYDGNPASGGIAIGSAETANWQVRNTPPPNNDASVNGVWEVSRVLVQYNTQEIQLGQTPPAQEFRYPDLRNDELITMNMVIEENNAIDEPGGVNSNFGIGFGKRNQRDNFNDTTDQGPPVLNTGDAGSFDYRAACFVYNNNFSTSKPFTSKVSGANFLSGTSGQVHLLTHNGFNGYADGPPPNQTEFATVGSLAVWFPNESRWVVFRSANKDFLDRDPSSQVPDALEDQNRYKGGAGLFGYGGNRLNSADEDPASPPYPFGTQLVSNEVIGWQAVNATDDEMKNITGTPEQRKDLGSMTFVFYDRLLTSSQIAALESLSDVPEEWVFDDGGGGESENAIPTIGSLISTADHAMILNIDSVTFDGASALIDSFSVDVLQGNITMSGGPGGEKVSKSWGPASWIAYKIDPIADDGDIVAGDTISFYTNYMDSTTYDASDTTGVQHAFFWYEFDTTTGTWKLLGYRTGSRVINPDGGTSTYPLHMYWNGSDGSGSANRSTTIKTVLYLYNRREDFDTFVPANLRDVSAWDATNGVDLP